MFLDSTFLIDFLRGEPKAISLLTNKDSSSLYTSEINVFELIEGAYSINWDVQKHLEKVYALINRLNVLPFDRKCALKAGEIAGKLAREGKKIGETDCLIAGVALANGITTLVTENKLHFSRISDLDIIDY
ncbi:type II toxin-antitoxin system VapC family toxin [Candidatus Woesearchaeota archaeon]|nr:type II toxin-antitoxin system VapC family toxin [Candidatus Woesearchaeota archaeon]